MSLGARAFYLKTVDINEMEERVNDLLKTMPPVRNGEKGR
jgi:hypothetical protein